MRITTKKARKKRYIIYRCHGIFYTITPFPLQKKIFVQQKTFSKRKCNNKKHDTPERREQKVQLLLFHKNNKGKREKKHKTGRWKITIRICSYNSRNFDD